MGEFTVNTEGQPFNLPYTLDSGQAFRWSEKGNYWYGVLGGGVLKVRQEGATLTCSSSSELLDTQAVYHYFALDEDLERILASIMKDAQHHRGRPDLLRAQGHETGHLGVPALVRDRHELQHPPDKGDGLQPLSALRRGGGVRGREFWLFPDAESLARGHVPNWPSAGSVTGRGS